LWILAIILLVVSIGIVAGVVWLFDSKGWAVVAALGCILLFGSVVWWNWATTYRDDHWATCHVTGKDRGGDDGSYRIYTSDCGQLANQDSVLRLKFDSADVWQQIPNQGPVELRIAGLRFGPLSQFPNVFDVREVPAR
jgi:hypothetical protein